MNEFDSYLAGNIEDTPMQKAMSGYNARLSSGAKNEFTDYLDTETQPKPLPAGPRRAALEAKSAKFKADAARLRGEAEEENSLASYGRAAIRGVAAGASDLADTATLGGYKKVRDYALEKLDHQSLKNIRQSEDEFHAPITGNPLMRAAQMGTSGLNTLVGYGTGAGGLIGKAARGITERAGAGIAGGLAGGAAAGGATAGLESAVQGNQPLDVARDAAIGAGGGAVVGGAFGAVAKGLKGAPARRLEAEIGGLTEGVQTKSKITKFLPKEEQIRAELGSVPQIREAILNDPKAALPAAEEKLSEVAERQLQPFFDDMKNAGADQVDAGLVISNLNAVKSQFTKHAEGAQQAAIEHLISGLTADAAANGGKLPAQMLREEATAFQRQGFANIPMFPPIPLTKEMKQGIGGALREAIADHIGSISDKATADAFRLANQRTSTWYAIKDLMEEKVQRLKTGSKPLMEHVRDFNRAVSNPLMRVVLPGVEPGAKAIDRNIIAPIVSSRAGHAIGNVGQAAGTEAPVIGGANAADNPIMDMIRRAIEEKRRKDEAAAGNLYGGVN